MTGKSTPQPEPRIPVPFRMSPAGKAAVQAAAAKAGYSHYTAWIRDLCAAEITTPRHNLKPRKPAKEKP